MIGLKFNIAEIRDVIKGIEETPEKILSLLQVACLYLIKDGIIMENYSSREGKCQSTFFKQIAEKEFTQNY